MPTTQLHITSATWQPLESPADLPDDDLQVLIYDELGNIAIAHHTTDTGWIGADDYYYTTLVTHWADLPHPPESLN